MDDVVNIVRKHRHRLEESKLSELLCHHSMVFLHFNCQKSANPIKSLSVITIIIIYIFSPINVLYFYLYFYKKKLLNNFLVCASLLQKHFQHLFNSIIPKCEKENNSVILVHCHSVHSVYKHLEV